MTQAIEHQASGECRQVATLPDLPSAPERRRLRAYALGVELLPDGRAVAVGLIPSRNRLPRAFVHVASCVEELAQDLRARRITCKRLNLSLPRQKFIMKSLHLPSVDTDEIRAMLGFELQGAIPFGEGKNVTAYLAAPSDEAGYSDVSAFITPDTVVEQHVASLCQAGRGPDRIVASPVLLLAWARILCGLNAAESGALLLLAVGPAAMEMVCVKDGRLGYCRSIAVKSGGTNLAAVAGEALRTFSAVFLGDGDAQVVLVGPSRQTAKLAQQLSREPLAAGVIRRGGIQCVSALGSVDDQAAPASWDDLSTAVACAAGAAAVEFMPELAGFDLRVESLVRPRHRSGFRRQLAVSVGLGLLLIGLGGAGIQRQMQQEQEQIDRLKAQIEPIQKTALVVSDKRQKLMLLRSHLAGRDRSLLALTELHRIVPEGINLTQLTVVGVEMKITAQARTPDLAYAFPSILASSKFFPSVQFVAAQPVVRDGRTVTEFSCNCRIATSEPDAVDRR